MFDEIVYKSGEIFCTGVFKVSPTIAHFIDCITDMSISIAILAGDDSLAVVADFYWGLFFLIFGFIILVTFLGSLFK